MNSIIEAQERYQKVIRKFNTSNLLKYFSAKSLELYNDGKKSFVIVDVPYYNKRTGERGISKNFNYGQWDLIQICYDSIKYSNDYRGDNVDESSYYYLLNEHKMYEKKIEKIEHIDKIHLYEHLECIANVQFDFQHIPAICDFNRMYHMINNINKNIEYDQSKKVSYINLEIKLEELTKLPFGKLVNIFSLIVLIFMSGKSLNSKELVDMVQRIGCTKEDLEIILELISKDYAFYKNTDNWNMLRFNPIVKTKNEYIVTNIFALSMFLPNFLYWTIRNYYRDIKSDEFNIYFGVCFENYLNEIMKFYNIKYERLKESKKKNIKMPDWKIETNKYIFLVEQKATLFPIGARITTDENRYKCIESFLENCLIKGFRQLNSYHVTDTDKTVIRICLTLERIHIDEIVKEIIEEKNIFNSDKDLNWIVNISHFEILMEILSTDEDKFDKIIENKIELEKNKDTNGRNFEKILGGYKYNYVSKEINHFDEIIKNIVEKLKNK